MKNLNTKKKWSDYLWITSALYLFLGFFNILFAWVGLLCFFIPLILSMKNGNKTYCHNYCGRGQLFDLLGNSLKLSRNKSMPVWLKHRYFRYGFLAFFMLMFFNMLFGTYLVFREVNDLQQFITIFWTFRLPWNLFELPNIAPWISQFAFGFYSVMLTSTLLGLITMFLYRPRSWCVYCPMGTMTQGISILKNKVSSK